jgi:hypothetical protein
MKTQKIKRGQILIATAKQDYWQTKINFFKIQIILNYNNYKNEDVHWLRS